MVPAGDPATMKMCDREEYVELPQTSSFRYLTEIEDAKRGGKQNRDSWFQ